MKKLVFVGFLFFSHFVFAEKDLSKNLQYGFDWLNPKNAKCVLLDEKAADLLKDKKAMCTPGYDAFGIEMGVYFSCSYSENGKSYEYLYYQNKEKCNYALEIMESHGEE